MFVFWKFFGKSLLQENRSTDISALVIKILLPAITIRLVVVKNKFKFVKKCWD